MPNVARRGWFVMLALASTACPDGGAGDGTTTTSSSSTSDEPATTTTTTVVDADSSSTTTAAATTLASTTQPDTTTGEPVMPVVLFPRTSILPEELAVIVNDDDPLSSQIADYYVAARGLPATNVVHVSLPLVPELTPEQFDPILADVEAELPAGIQALAL